MYVCMYVCVQKRISSYSSCAGLIVEMWPLGYTDLDHSLRMAALAPLLSAPAYGGALSVLHHICKASRTVPQHSMPCTLRSDYVCQCPTMCLANISSYEEKPGVGPIQRHRQRDRLQDCRSWLAALEFFWSPFLTAFNLHLFFAPPESPAPPHRYSNIHATLVP